MVIIIDGLPEGWTKEVIWLSKDGQNRKYQYVGPDGQKFSNKQKMLKHNTTLTKQDKV